MSSNPDEYQVTRVRTLESDTNNTNSYTNNVTVCLLHDNTRKLVYFCIKHNGTKVFAQELSMLYWVSESSLDGVATIRSQKMTIVVLYNEGDALLVDFFQSLQKSLLNKRKRVPSLDSASSEPNPDQLKHMIDQLVQSINTGNSDQAEHIAKELAELRVNVQFSLNNKNDHKQQNVAKSKSNTHNQRSPDSLIQLTVCIECFSNKDPSIASIEVLPGTTLQSLKTQIESETGIKSTDQYWFAFKQYLIPDDYVFGSFVSFIPNLNQRTSLGNSILSGDTLVMYIAQTSPNH